MEERSQRDAGDMLDKLKPAHQSQIVAAMTSIELLLTNGHTLKFDAKPSYILRDPRAGDFGWIISRHAQLCSQEYGWGERSKDSVRRLSPISSTTSTRNVSAAGSLN